MIPILLDLKFIKIYTLGVFLVLAFFWAAYLLWRNIRMTSYKEEDIFDGLFTSILGGLFVARLVYVSLNFKDFGFDILKFILVNGYPGLSMLGGLAGGIGSFYLFCRSRKIDFLKVMQYAGSPLFLALTVGKLGSFFAGTDIGTKTSFFLQVVYKGYQGGRHLTALYEAIFYAVGSYISYHLIFMMRREKYAAGSGLVFFILYVAVVELLLDNLKQNHLYFAGFSFNLLVAIVAVIVGAGYFLAKFIQKNGKHTHKNTA